LETADIRILENLKNNSEPAFDELFRKYYKKLVFFAIKIVKNQDTASEVVQDLFVNFWEKRHQLEPKISLQAYLYRSVYNNCVHLSKKEKKFQGDELTIINEPSEDFNNLLENTELEVRIYDLIEQLPPECRKIFKLETQMSRALKYLRQNLWDYIKMLIFILLS